MCVLSTCNSSFSSFNMVYSVSNPVLNFLMHPDAPTFTINLFMNKFISNKCPFSRWFFYQLFISFVLIWYLVFCRSLYFKRLNNRYKATVIFFSEINFIETEKIHNGNRLWTIQWYVCFSDKVSTIWCFYYSLFLNAALWRQ